MAADFIETVQTIIGDGTTPVVSVNGDGVVTATNSNSVWSKVAVMKEEINIFSGEAKGTEAAISILQTDITDKRDQIDVWHTNIEDDKNIVVEVREELVGDNGVIPNFYDVFNPNQEYIADVGNDLVNKDVHGTVYDVGTSRILTVGEDIAKGSNSAIKIVAEDLQDTNSSIDDVSDNMNAIVAVHTDISKVGNNTADLSTYSLIGHSIENAQDAKDSAELAMKWASAIEDEQVIVGNYSSRHYSAKAEQSATLANEAKETALENAAVALENAENSALYRDSAKAYRDELTGLDVRALTLVEGSSASASYDSGDGMLSIGIPKGLKGDRGAALTIDAVGSTAGRDDYDEESTGFAYMDNEAGLLYIKNTSASGDWGVGLEFAKGDRGIGIFSLLFKSTTDDSGDPSIPGAIDTYEITFDDSTTTTFDVSNGTDFLAISKIDRSVSVAGTETLSRYDKLLGNLDVIASFIDGDDTTIRYTGDDDDSIYYRDVLVNNTEGDLVEVRHYYGTSDLTSPSATTTLTYAEGEPIPATSYTE